MTRDAAFPCIRWTKAAAVPRVRTDETSTPMKDEVLEILQCPQCSGGLRIEVVEEKTGEIRRGGLVCSGERPHRYPIVDGIIRFASGLAHDAVRSELPDASLSCITCTAAIHHTPDLHRTLRECHRTLKPGGVAAIVNEEFVSVRHRFLSPRKEVTDTGSHHDISYREFESAAKATGFA